MGYNVSGEAVMVSLCLPQQRASIDYSKAIEWTLFALAYALVGLRIGVRVARRQQKHVIISDCLLIASALDCLGLIICKCFLLGGVLYHTD